MDQTLPLDRYEVIVVDDGSEDGTDALVRQMQERYGNLRFVRQFNQGPAVARNRGVDLSRGEFLVFIDSDCVCPRDFLEMFLNFFEKRSDVAAIGGEPYLRVDRGFFSPLSPYFKMRSEQSGRTPFVMTSITHTGCKLSTCCSALRKEAFEEIGGFNEKFRNAGEDPDLWFRFLKKGHHLMFLGDVNVAHCERTTVADLFNRYFHFGLADVINIKDHFRNCLIIEFPPALTSQFICWRNFFMTFCLSMGYNKFILLALLAILLSGFVSLWLPVFLSLVVLGWHYVQVRRLDLTWRLILYKLIMGVSFSAGKAFGSLKYGIICL